MESYHQIQPTVQMQTAGVGVFAETAPSSKTTAANAECRLHNAFIRWLLLMSMQKAFNKFKQFMRQPTILGSLLLLVLSTPSSAAFHLLYNKFGFGFRPSILFALATPFLIALCLLLVYRYLLEESIKTFLANFTFNKMLQLNFPTVYTTPKSFGVSPFVAIQAIKSEDPVVRLFGLKQLQQCCTGTPQERLPMFSLSQPGCHPRNWMTIREVALEFVQAVRTRLNQETRSRTIQTTLLKNKSPNGSICANQQGSPNSPSIVLNELYEGKQSFFVPPTLKPRSADQFQAEIKHQAIRLPFFLEFFLDKAKNVLFFRPPIVSTHDTLCILLGIQTLSSLIAHSLEEDQFGVVQKDLKQCLAALTRLSIAIDAYVRASGRTSKTPLPGDFNIHLLDEELAKSLKQIRDVFGPYINDLDLHPTELEVFRVLV